MIKDTETTIRQEVLRRLFNKIPEFQVEYVNIAAKVNGESYYAHGKYYIKIKVLETMSIKECIAITCHEIGHIKLDEKLGVPGDHIHEMPVNSAAYLAKEVPAWVAGKIYAVKLGVGREYMMWARAIITLKDEDKMHKSTLTMWKEFLMEG